MQKGSLRLRRVSGRSARRLVVNRKAFWEGHREDLSQIPGLSPEDEIVARGDLGSAVVGLIPFDRLRDGLPGAQHHFQRRPRAERVLRRVVDRGAVESLEDGEVAETRIPSGDRHRGVRQVREGEVDPYRLSGRVGPRRQSDAVAEAGAGAAFNASRLVLDEAASDRPRRDVVFHLHETVGDGDAP